MRKLIIAAALFLASASAAFAQVTQAPIGPGPLPPQALLGLNNVWTAPNTFHANGSASNSPLLLDGTILTGGSGTTNFPAMLIQPSGTTLVTTWSTNGTGLGMNMPSGFSGSFLDFHIVGGGSLFTVSGGGSTLANGFNQIGAAQYFGFAGRSHMYSSSDGTFQFRNNANNADATFTAAGATFSGLSTGTNADFLCLSAGGVVLLQTSACTISSLRFKQNVKAFTESALAKIDALDVDTFTYKAKNKDPNGNVKQLGLIAEDVAKKIPVCAEYETDMKTPKSYKQECLIGLLVKATQEQSRQIANDNERIARLEKALARK